jgi:hypothetical protein
VILRYINDVRNENGLMASDNPQQIAIRTVAVPEGEFIDFPALFRRSLAAHAYFVLFALLYFLVTTQLFPTSAFERLEGLATASVSIAVFILLAGGILQFWRFVFVSQPAHPILQMLHDLTSLLRNSHRMATIVPMGFGMAVFVESFIRVKINVPAFGGFKWDETFTQWDRILHFGKLPWEWLQPVVGSWPITLLISVNYNCWIVVMWLVWVFYAFTAQMRPERTRFLISFMLIWSIGGSLLAVVFSSAGPCYYDVLGLDPNPYLPLLTYLRDVNEVVPIWALDVQQMLWQGQLGNASPLGISAMPSLHNAIALLLVLVSKNFSKTIRYALFAHAALIFVGSIHLAWHYAVDAYLAWALTLVVWFAAGPLARWWDEQPASRGYWALAPESLRPDRAPA